MMNNIQMHPSYIYAKQIVNDEVQPPKLYYERKVAEGKNKMSVLNAIRNKLIHIIYALIKNEIVIVPPEEVYNL